jgi:magnesium transporter
VIGVIPVRFYFRLQYYLINFVSMSETTPNVEKVKQFLASSLELAKPLLKHLHPSDIAQILEDVSPETRKRIIGFLSVEMASEAIVEMDEESRPEELLMQLTPSQAARIIEELDPDDAADLLAQIPLKDLRNIMARLQVEDTKQIEQLMKYDEETAGGIMTPELLKVPDNFSKREAMEEVLRISDEMEDFYVIYVVDDHDILLGTVSINDLIRAKPWVKVRELIDENCIKVHVDTDQEEVARMISKYNLAAIPVVDSMGHLLGRITFDDVMDVLEEENTEDILRIAGVSEDEELRGGWRNAVKSRLPWLLVNLLTAFIAGLVISTFSDTIDKIVIIASFMPIVAGVAGNSATQALAVTIRRISTDRVNASQNFKVIIKELIVGLVNGLLLGTITGVAAFLLGGNSMLGLVVFMAMVGNLLIGAFAGSAIPLFLNRINVDPAVASSILMTALTDILGFTLLLGLARVILTV